MRSVACSVTTMSQVLSLHYPALVVSYEGSGECDRPMLPCPGASLPPPPSDGVLSLESLSQVENTTSVPVCPRYCCSCQGPACICGHPPALLPWSQDKKCGHALLCQTTTESHYQSLPVTGFSRTLHLAGPGLPTGPSPLSSRVTR